MKENPVTKKFLMKIILGETGPLEDKDSPEGDMTRSLFHQHWNAGNTTDQGHKPDFRKLFEKIKAKTHPEDSEKSISTKFFIKEIDRLREKNRLLSRRYRAWLGVAASLLFVFCIASFVLMSRTNMLEKTVTESIAPNGQKSQLLLADGTKVFLNSGNI